MGLWNKKVDLVYLKNIRENVTSIFPYETI